MPDYRSMYYHLAGKVADAVDLLVQAQLEGEEAAAEEHDINVIFTKKEPENEV